MKILIKVTSCLIVCCVLISPAYSQGLDIEPSGVSVLSRTIWKTNQVAVCWENPTAANVQERNWVQQSVQTSWEPLGRLRFVDWNQCLPNNSGIRILIDDDSDGPHVKRLGSELNGIQNGMVLNFTFQNWSTECRNGGQVPNGFNSPNRIPANTEQEYCIRIIAIHEFGHAVGIAHEQNRPDAPDWCRAERQGTDGDWSVTPYDLNSVMNYCNPAWSGNGLLSNLDISGYEFLYGDKNVQLTAATSWGAGRIDVFGTGTHGNVLQLWYQGGWHWTVLGSHFPSSRFDGPVTSTSWGSNRIDVFGLDADGNVLQMWWNGRWNWTNLGNGFDGTRFEGDIEAVSWGPNRIDVFGMDANGNVLQLWWNGSWHWTNLGNGFGAKKFEGSIAATSWGNNRIDIFGSDSDGNVLQLWWNGAWHWSNLGNGFGGKIFEGPIKAASWGNNRIDVFGLDREGNVLQLWWSGGWNWTELGNGFSGNRFESLSGATSWGGNRIDIFGPGDTGDVLQLWWNGNWNWSALGNNF